MLSGTRLARPVTLFRPVRVRPPPSEEFRGAHVSATETATERLPGCLLLTACGLAAPATLRRGVLRGCRHRRCSQRLRQSFLVVCRAAGSSQEQKELRLVFEEVAAGRDTIAFEEAVRLDTIDDMLEAEAATLKELATLWGDKDQPLRFDAFSEWYFEVLDEYGDVLAENRDDNDGLDGGYVDVYADRRQEKTWTDEDLIEDDPSPEFLAAQKEAAASRSYAEVALLFREQCDDKELLSFEGLCNIDEIASLVSQGDMTTDELQEIWRQVPKEQNLIDLKTFTYVMERVDELFEFEDDGSEQDGGPGEGQEPSSSSRDTSTIKGELVSVIQSTVEADEKPCGIAREYDDADAQVIELAQEMEKAWRSSRSMMEFESTDLQGTWELFYTTSSKLRKFKSVLNAENSIAENAKFEALVQGFDVSDGKLDYDLEELVSDEYGNQLGIRGMGTFSLSHRPSYINNGEDLLLEIELDDAEFDGDDDKSVEAEAKVLGHEICRTFCYGYVVYSDADFLLVRAGLAGSGFYVWRRMVDAEED